MKSLGHLLPMNLVDELVISVVNSRIYWHDHPRVSGSLEDVKQLLESYLELARKDSLTLGILDDCLVLDGRPLLGATLSAPLDLGLAVEPHASDELAGAEAADATGRDTI